MDVWLTDSVHAVMIDDDIVFLDVASNAYFCLPDIGAVLAMVGRRLAVSAEGLAEDLLAAGLAVVTPSGQAPPQVSPPARTARAVIDADRNLRGQGPSLAHWRQAIIAGLAARAAERRGFADRLPPAKTLAAPAPTSALLADLVAYRAMQPLLPFDGACLFRSQMLRAYLHALGHHVDWIFGVRTWPFGAHCWLQAGDLVLDDEAERLVAYRPIMVR